MAFREIWTKDKRKWQIKKVQTDAYRDFNINFNFRQEKKYRIYFNKMLPGKNIYIPIR